MDDAEVALSQRVAGLGRQRQPAQRQRVVDRHALPVGEAAADVVLGTRHAGMRQRSPERQCRLVVVRLGERPRTGHERLRVGLGRAKPLQEGADHGRIRKGLRPVRRQPSSRSIMSRP